MRSSSGTSDVPQGQSDRSPTADPHPVLTARVSPPRTPARTVPRPRLQAMLAEGLRGPVTLISAGPGAGKTVLTAELAAAEGWRGAGVPARIAWLTLDDTDDDLRTFWSDILTALRQAAALPSNSPLYDLSPGSSFGPGDVDMVRTGLAELPAPVALVLDDLQQVRSGRVLDSLNRLLSRPPPPLRLVLVTRSDPGLRLHRLRLDGALTEIRAEDLMFDRPEAARLLAEHGLDCSSEQRDKLLARTEGWAAGLRLAAMSLDPGNLEAGIADFSGDLRPVAEYLVGELLDRLPARTRSFLLVTSIADQVSGSLAAELTGRADGLGLLEELTAEHALVTAVGARREWFRYHTLLREYLRHQLRVESPGEMAGLHRTLSRWLERHGMPVEAVRHAVLSGDLDEVGRMLCTDALPRIESPEGPALAAALRPVAERADAQPSLPALLCAAVWHQYRHEFAGMGADLRQARTLLDSAEPQLRTPAEIVLSLGETTVARADGDIATVLEQADRALSLLDGTSAPDLPAAPRYTVLARNDLGVGQLWSGRDRPAVANLTAVVGQAQNLDLDLIGLDALAHLAVVDVTHGRLRAGTRRARAALRHAERRGWTLEPQLMSAHLAIALAELQRDKLDAAGRELSQGLAAGRGRPDRAAELALRIAEVQLLVQRGETERALAAVAELPGAETDGFAVPDLLAQWMRDVEAEVHLLAGDPAAVLARPGPGGQLSAWARVCLARADLALGEPARAKQRIDPGSTPQPDAVAVAVQDWLVVALADDALRQDGAAIEAVTRAMALAEGEEIIYPFRALGERILPLVRRQQELMGSYPGFAQIIVAEQLAGVTDSPAEGTPLLEHLTERELTVLRYLPTMSSNDEIGADLHISVNTVKAHLRTLYRKLDVNSRRSAVRRARSIGLLWMDPPAGRR